MSTSKSLIQRARVRRNVGQWQDIIRRFEQSGQTRDAFCAEQSLALSTFSRWRQRLRAGNVSPPESHQEVAFVELSTADVAVAGASSSSWDVELQLGADIVLRLRRSC
ncbi:MAG: IS66 family insertion sequence element accessory protein TnpB [Aestuariibacter sp.]|nr:IS66 family insertion sequence element accessory protein TnpB [Aestuariibacter sp.]